MLSAQEREAVATLLEETADGFESGRYGWTKGTFEVRGAYCAAGAILRRSSCEAPTGVKDLALISLQDRVGSVTRWNDSLPSDTGVTTVINTMKQVAKDLRNQEPEP